MKNIRIGRYSNPSNVGGWLGWIEPENKEWILFVHEKFGRHKFYPERDSRGGVV